MQRMRLFLTLGLILFLFSCKKNNDDTNGSNVQVINACVSSGSIDVMTASFPLAQNVAYGTASGYQNVPSGSSLNASVNITGSATVWASGLINLVEDKSYTMVASDNVTTMQVGIVEDDLTAPASGQSKLRFLHLSRNAPPVNIEVGGVTLFTQRSYNDYLANSGLASFTGYTVPSGAPVNVSVYVYGVGALLYTLPSAGLQVGRIYTLALIGEPGGSGNASLRCVLLNN